LVEPRALEAFVRLTLGRAQPEIVTFDDQAGPLMAFVPVAQADRLEGARSPLSAAAADRGVPDEEVLTVMAPHFCRRVEAGADPTAVARAYARHLNGPKESFFTKIIRRFSVPLSVELARVGVSPTIVTLGGLVVALAAAACLARQAYLWGLAGALLYYASMVLDCSDGEVARLSFRDSSFGAWLETAVDYATYMLLLVAFTIRGPGAAGSVSGFRTALLLALGGSLVVIAVASYLRHRVAARDPGEFDAASARALKHSSRFHRFARWGRQWIKRSTIAHLLVALAVVGQLPVLIYLWAFGATVAAVVIVGVEPFVVSRVKVRPVGLTRS
jgi:phosphatidylglycerophosphate synthase